MTSKIDNRVQAFKEGISEIAMEEIIFSTICGFEPDGLPLLMDRATDAFPMIKFGIDKGYHSIEIIGLNKTHIGLQQELDGEKIKNMFSARHKPITKRSIPVNSKGAVIKDESTKNEVISFMDDLDKRYSPMKNNHLVYGPQPRSTVGAQNVLDTSDAFQTAHVMTDNVTREKNNLRPITDGLQAKVALAYMRERNTGLMEILAKHNPVATGITNGADGEIIEQRISYKDMIDMNLMDLQTIFVRNPNSMQSAVINHYRKMLKESINADIDAATNEADNIMADVVERNSHAPVNGK